MSKPSSFLQKFVTYGRREFYNIGPKAIVIKLFTAVIHCVPQELGTRMIVRVTVSLTLWPVL
jgi:hypothetical protein